MQSIKFAERSKNKDLNNAVNTLDFITMYYSFSPQSRKCTFFFLHQAVNYKSLVYTQLQCPRPARSTPLCMFISPVRLCEVDLYGQGLPVLQLLDDLPTGRPSTGRARAERESEVRVSSLHPDWQLLLHSSCVFSQSSPPLGPYSRLSSFPLKTTDVAISFFSNPD